MFFKHIRSALFTSWAKPLKKHADHILPFQNFTMYLVILTHISWEVGHIFSSFLVIWIHLGIDNLVKVLDVGMEMGESYLEKLEMDTLFN